MDIKTALTRRKTTSPDSGLVKVLGPWDLTFLGIGAIIGTGIFVLTGHAAAEQAGPAVILSFVVAGLASAFAALAYAELAASVGGAGSAYGYSYAAFGELMAWIIGWDLLLEYGVSVATVANGWSGYFGDALTALGMPMPARFLNGPFANPPGIVNLPALGVILFLTGLLCIGVKNSARLNTGIVFIKLLTVAIFIGVAAFHVDARNWHPFAPYGWFGHDAGGKPIGILAGASIVFFAYVGFDAVSTAVEEARNPQRDVPRGLLGALAFCTVIYIIVCALLTGIVPYQSLDVPSPVAHALQQIGISWASGLIATGVIAGLITVMLVLFYGLTRILLAMARDGLLPAFFARVSPDRHVPVRNTVICGVIMALAAGFTPLGILAELVNIGTLAAFVLVCAGVIVLRRTQPEKPRPFVIPLGPVIPVLGVVSCAALIAFLPLETDLRFLVWGWRRGS